VYHQFRQDRQPALSEGEWRTEGLAKS
jgi:hypothetical protein